ncbi:MAG: electron transfer flavoprotein subunit beta [Proteobacteria bacterium]|nr:electron transfer flavoprotein subunit beta [Pseudomonadota bacterium]
MKHALILVEHDGVNPHSALRRIVSAARLLADRLTLLVAGSQAQAVAEQAACIAGVSEVWLFDAPHLSQPLAEDLSPLLAHAVRERQASALLAAASPFGKATLPRAAALLDCAMLSDVVEIQAPDVFVRPVHAGAALATLRNPEPVKILSARAAAFPPAADQPAAPINIQPAPPAANRSAWVSTTHPDSARPALAEAKVVVAGGQGLGSAEQFHALLDPLADRLNAAIGATRAAVDAGFIGNDHQIGQTGAIVAPEFYFAIGLSGAAQHLAGMRDARVVVTINKDAEAPICRQADYVLEGDLFEIVPALLRALE